MKVILFGGTGMVGQGVLHECLLDDRVTEVLAVGRKPIALHHSKLKNVVHGDLMDLTAIESQLAGYEACFFCLGVSSVGMKEPEYRQVTYDYTLSVANTFAKVSPQSTFVYVSGAGTDSSEQGRTMWARVKGQTENDLLGLPLAAYMFRPGIVQPMRGIKSKTRLYRAGYTAASPLLWVLKRVAPNVVTTTDDIGRAMIRVASSGFPKRILESSDIRTASHTPS